MVADTADGGFRRVLRELDQCISGVTVTGIRDGEGRINRMILYLGEMVHSSNVI